MRIIAALFLSGIVLFFTACRKEKPPQQAQVKFINGSVNSTGLDLSIGGTLLFSGVGFPGCSVYNSIIASEGVTNISPNTGTVNYASETYDFEENINYTFIVADSINKLKLSRITDNGLTTPAAGKAKIRFFHLGSNIPSMDVAVGATNLFTSRSFNDQTIASANADFISVDAGSYTFTAKQASTSNVLFSSNNIVLENGKIYTIIAKGATGAIIGSAQEPGFTIFTYN